MSKKNVARTGWQYAILASGLSVCLIGALLMVVGESILGENHSGIATVVGIIGIGLIGTSGATLGLRNSMNKEENEDNWTTNRVVA